MRTSAGDLLLLKKMYQHPLTDQNPRVKRANYFLPTGRSDHQLAAGVQVVRHATRERTRTADLHGSGKEGHHNGGRGKA